MGIPTPDKTGVIHTETKNPSKPATPRRLTNNTFHHVLERYSLAPFELTCPGIKRAAARAPHLMMGNKSNDAIFESLEKEFTSAMVRPSHILSSLFVPFSVVCVLVADFVMNCRTRDNNW